nr:hypothetical protein Iba_scaffold43296CG0010 [Ipomoea batatas]GMD48902.1 hypothetical protein Iba_scaffold46659CG0010 [Ipomoea batatas]
MSTRKFMHSLHSAAFTIVLVYLEFKQLLLPIFHQKLLISQLKSSLPLQVLVKLTNGSLIVLNKQQNPPF